MRVLGFDPAASFGWCVLDDGSYVDGGAEVFKRPTASRIKAGVHPSRKWLEAHSWVGRTITGFAPDFVFCEDVRRHAGTIAAHHYGYYRLTLEAWCAASGVPFYGIGVGQWKKLLGVGGNAPKDIVLDEVQRRFTGIEIVTHDHSDACGIAAAGSLLVAEGQLHTLTSKSKRA